MKKLIALLLAVTMLFGLAACGGSGDAASSGAAPAGSSAPAGDSSGPQKLTLILRGGSYADVIKAALPEFEAAHNVKCEVLDLSFDDLHTKIALDALNEKGAYDLCMVDGSWMAEFTANGVLANLTELGYELDEDIIPNTTSICMVDDQVYLAPYFGNVTILMYNKQLLADAGYDIADVDSWDDVLKVCADAKANGKEGFLIRGDSGDNYVSDFLPFLLAHGGWVVDENNNPTIDTPEFKAAMEEYLELIATGTAMSKDDVTAAIDNGSAAMSVGWPGWYVPGDDTAASYTVIPASAAEGGEEYATSEYGIWTLGVCDNSQNKELAVELLKFIMDPETQLESIANGGVPCRYSCLQNPEVVAEMPHLEIVCGALENGVYRPVIEEWAEFTNLLGAEMDNIVHGVKTVEQGLADAQMQIEMLLA